MRKKILSVLLSILSLVLSFFFVVFFGSILIVKNIVLSIINKD